MDLGLLVLDDRPESFHQNRAYLIEVKVDIVEDILLQIVG